MKKKVMKEASLNIWMINARIDDALVFDKSEGFYVS